MSASASGFTMSTTPRARLKRACRAQQDRAQQDADVIGEMGVRSRMRVCGWSQRAEP
ncbi:MAG: hypothetical protein JO240_09245 [Solirubrobacterales bacterium]|nr:hypothetical protein [Solirubrobacterales bacterium]